MSDSPEPSAPEAWLLKLVLLNEDLADWTCQHLDTGWIQHPQVRELINLWREARNNHSWTNLPSFLSSLPDPALQNLITAATVVERPVPNPAQQVGDVVLRLRNQFLDRQIAALTRRASQPELGEPERLGFLRQQQELRSLKRQPLGPLASATQTQT